MIGPGRPVVHSGCDRLGAAHEPSAAPRPVPDPVEPGQNPRVEAARHREAHHTQRHRDTSDPQSPELGCEPMRGPGPTAVAATALVRTLLVMPGPAEPSSWPHGGPDANASGAPRQPERGSMNTAVASAVTSPPAYSSPRAT